MLIWLEADTILRRVSGGKRSMDDFCHRFHGGKSGPPQVVPYTFDDVVATMNDVAPYDWRRFFEERLSKVAQHAPMGGLEASGWRLVYTDAPNQVLADRADRNDANYWTFTLGMDVNKDGALRDVIPGTPAAKAGLAPGMKLVAVNGRAWTTELVEAAIKKARTSLDPIELLVANTEYYQTYKIDYHEGMRYPHLERIAGKPDVLKEISAAHAK